MSLVGVMAAERKGRSVEVLRGSPRTGTGRESGFSGMNS